MCMCGFDAHIHKSKWSVRDFSAEFKKSFGMCCAFCSIIDAYVSKIVHVWL